MEFGNGIGNWEWNWIMELGLEINGSEIGIKLEMEIGKRNWIMEMEWELELEWNRIMELDNGIGNG
jgi:hypothetical protein